VQRLAPARELVLERERVQPRRGVDDLLGQAEDGGDALDAPLSCARVQYALL
jgi:hypothetical protein